MAIKKTGRAVVKNKANKSSRQKAFAGPLSKLSTIESDELEVGNSFHAFRFNVGGSVGEALKELKVLEKSELNVGSSFHAFRFNSAELRELTEVEKSELSVGNAFHAFRFK